MWSRIIKTSLALYIPLLIFTLVWGYLQKHSLITNIAHIQQRNIQNKSYHLEDQCEVLIDITSYWSNVVFPANFSNGEPLDSAFINEYIRIMQGYEVYDQLRFLDLHGDEILRYERTDDKTMEPKDLQRKVDRSYFQKGLSLKKGQVYISPIELNKENGVIEKPYKPVIRGVTPIFDADQIQIGLAVTNFNMNKVFDLMKARISEDNFYLVDKDRNVITTNLSNNVLPHQASMSQQDSSIKKKLQLRNLIFEKDTFFMEKGSLWVFQNVNIGFGKNTDISLQDDIVEVITENDWAIIQEIPPSYISKRLKTIRRNLILFNILTLIVISLFAFGYGRTQKEKRNFVTELKQKNKALLDSQNRLKSTNRLVKQANDRLQVRNRQLEDFNYVVAHNLKAPVTSMSIIVDMLSKAKNQETFNELLPKLETISKNISTLTQDVHTYVSILNNTKLELENVNLLLLLKEVENDFVETLVDKEAKNFETIYKLDAWHTLKCSRFYMKSILQNFLSNAIKYRRTDVNSHIIFESAWENDQKVLFIKDNGLGIDLAQHGNNLFKLYKRFHRNISGKGMGLFIVRSQLEAMYASIEVESTVNQGTTFKIKFKTHEKTKHSFSG
ncbi:sensor histidine kinase [Muricauda sp. ANG21]|uniref:sensor histidine kinase n=1 Tax=Allomuricauda sp. ANG21 TaxID=3042468 RepID=UPI003454A7D9